MIAAAKYYNYSPWANGTLIHGPSCLGKYHWGKFEITSTGIFCWALAKETHGLGNAWMGLGASIGAVLWFGLCFFFQVKTAGGAE